MEFCNLWNVELSMIISKSELEERGNPKRQIMMEEIDKIRPQMVSQVKICNSQGTGYSITLLPF